MHPDAPALAAVAAGLDEILERVLRVAESHRADPDDPWTSDLDELERALTSTRRRLERMLQTH